MGLLHFVVTLAVHRFLCCPETKVMLLPIRYPPFILLSPKPWPWICTQVEPNVFCILDRILRIIQGSQLLMREACCLFRYFPLDSVISSILLY